MFRRAAPLIALAGAALTLLTACGSGSGGSDTISTTQPTQAGTGRQTASPAATASPSTATAAVKRPELKTDSRFTTVFEGWTSSDATARAVLNDGRYRALAIDSAILKLDPKAPEMGFYNTGSALATGENWVGGFKQHHLTITGVTRFYRPKVTIRADGTATLVYCTDESRAYAKNLTTGTVDVTTPSKDDYTKYNTVLKKNGQGVWQTTAVVALRGACRP